MVEVICPQCEECNYLVDNHKPELCTGNHSVGRIAEIQEDIAIYLPKGYKPYRKPYVYRTINTRDYSGNATYKTSSTSILLRKCAE